MNNNIAEKISKRYSDIGFEPIETSCDVLLFKNMFSVHCIFIVTNCKEVIERKDEYEDIFKSLYLSSDFSEDIYWNYYCIYIIKDDLDNTAFKRFKDNIEGNTKLARRFVFNENDIEFLPPLHLSVIKPTVAADSELWEKEWRDAIGSDLYEKLNSNPKSRIDELILEYLND